MTLGTTKGRKDDTNIHVLNWGGPLLGVQIPHTFPTPKMGIKQIEQFSDIISRILRSRLQSQSWNSFNPLPHKCFLVLTKSEMQELLHDFSKSSLVPAAVEVHTH